MPAGKSYYERIYEQIYFESERDDRWWNGKLPLPYHLRMSYETFESLRAANPDRVRRSFADPVDYVWEWENIRVKLDPDFPPDRIDLEKINA